MNVKKILRDKYSTCLLIVGFILSCFVAINVLSVMNKIKLEQNKYRDEEYKNFNTFMLENLDDISENQIDKVLNELRTDKGNVYIYGYYSFSGTGLYNPCIYLNLSENEETNQNIVWGRMPDKREADNNEHVVAVGTSMRPYIEETDGEKYITIDSVYYKVVGIYQTYKNLSQEDNMDICTYYECIDEKLKYNIVNFSVFNVKYGSSKLDEVSFQNQIKRIKEVLKDNGFVNFIDEKDETVDRMVAAKQQINQYFMYVTFIFTLINCMVISNIWIKRRHNELVIRRTFGYSMSDIIKLILKDMSVYAVISLAIGIVLQTIYSYTFGKNMLDMKFVGENALFLLVILGLIVVVSAMIPVMHIRKIIPSKDIRQQK